MKLVAKYTLVFGAILAAVLSVLAFARIQYTRGQIEQDMARDHGVVGHILQAGVIDIWLDHRGRPRGREVSTRETLALIERADGSVGTVRFEWVSGAHTVESQGFEGNEFVSRFPVRVGTDDVGSVVAREPRKDLDDAVRTDVLFSMAGIATIVVVGVLASLLMGAWLVGRPIKRLIQQARRIGRRELSNEVALHRRDELGELANEMSAASQALGDALAKTAAETEARLRAVEQLRHSDRLSTVGKLAAGIAHELGTPLSIVGGHAQMIAGKEVTGDAALASARAIDQEVTRMGKIVRQLLDFARRRGPEGTTCDPSEIAQRCASLLGLMGERTAVQCEVEVADPPLRAMIDEDSLQQVLTNLIVNGIQAMPRGGRLRVSISRALGAPPDSTTHPRPCVRVDVTDTGGGIPADVKAHIFEPFFTTKAPGDGTGLGLAVVHGIVVDHRGWISVETSERGTTFSVFLEEAG